MEKQPIMTGKIVLITGGTGGIGKQTALALAKLGARVIITGRSRESGEATVSELQQLSGNQQIDLLLADLATQSGVRSMAGQFTERYSHLDVLINNAGLVESRRRLTEDGVEADFAVNVVAPYLLTQLLMDHLRSSLSTRVINLTGGRHPSNIDLDNLQAERSFDGLNTYSHSKLVMMTVMVKMAQQMRGTNVTINVCYPGGTSTTMTRSVTPQMFPGLTRLFWPVFKLMTRADGGRSAAKAARSSVYLASSPDVEGMNGNYFDTDSKSVEWPKAVLDRTTRRNLMNIVERLTEQNKSSI